MLSQPRFAGARWSSMVEAPASDDDGLTGTTGGAVADELVCVGPAQATAARDRTRRARERANMRNPRWAGSDEPQRDSGSTTPGRGRCCQYVGRVTLPTSVTPRRLRALRHLEQRVRQQAMGLAMDGDRGIPVGGLDEAEDLAGSLVDPVVLVVDAVLVLNLDVGFVRTDDVGRLHAGQVMDIDEGRHVMISW